MNQTKQIRVLVADDHSIVRQGLIALINRDRGMKVVAQAGDGNSAVQQYARHRPDVCLMDLRMPHMDGVEAIRTICEKDPNANIIVLTTFDDDEDIYRALHYGAKAYLLKDICRRDLIENISAVHNGMTRIPHRVALKLATRIANRNLTMREREVLQLLAVGMSNKEIANELAVTEGTVKIHVNHLLQKLKASTRTEAARVALKRGLIRME
jgi:two-component system, NarL family, response regulator